MRSIFGWRGATRGHVTWSVGWTHSLKSCVRIKGGVEEGETQFTSYFIAIFKKVASYENSGTVGKKGLHQKNSKTLTVSTQRLR